MKTENAAPAGIASRLETRHAASGARDTSATRKGAIHDISEAVDICYQSRIIFNNPAIARSGRNLQIRVIRAGSQPNSRMSLFLPRKI